MAFNKSKALENALKYLNQGKPAQAIAEYQQILRADPKDQATLMTVGDLFARQGDMTQAVEYFERLAQVYLSDGFNSKAIAIYKKIAKLAPNELAPLERLADLYVQQGVLSEARPLFLQIAEAHLKANHAPKAVEVLHRLLEVEPENLRVQMRLAELYNVMGQKKEAAQTYLAYAQRLYDHGELSEAQKLADRALEVDPGNAQASLMRAKVLSSGDNATDAIAALAQHPDAESGGEVTSLLVDLELRKGQADEAIDLARKHLAKGHQNFGLLLHVAESLVESGQTASAFPLMTELRDPMIEAGEQDRFMKILSTTAERMPGRTEPLEMLADFCRTTSNPFHLNTALGQLADAYSATGNLDRAESALEELADRNKNDERYAQRLAQFRARRSGGAAPEETVAATEKPEIHETAVIATPEAPAEEQEAPSIIVEEPMDEETQRYIAQALTDVDLFSSYGLTQKATHLLENVLTKAPRHTPTLERLLDLYLGAGNERRTAELAAQLEQIHRDRHDNVNAERFAELRQRFQKVAGISEEELKVTMAPPSAAAATKPPAAAPPAPVEQASSAKGTAEPPPFEISLAPEEPKEANAPEFSISASPVETEESKAVAEVAPAKTEAKVEASAPAAPLEEVDLTDEWAAMAEEVSEPAAAPTAGAAAEPAAFELPAEEPSTQAADEALAEAVMSPEPAGQESEPQEVSLEFELPAEETAEAAREETAGEPAAPVREEHPEEAPAAASTEFELELTPESSAPAGAPKSTDDFISELVAEIEELEGGEAKVEQPAASASTPVAQAAPPAPAAKEKEIPAPVSASAAPSPKAPKARVPEAVPASVAASGPDTMNAHLAEVFQEFRTELGEMGDEDEDLETHYNLGIAYREMGLLDEAIGEFQKVAKAIQRGKLFPYAMNCYTLMALTFVDKGEAKVASIWYRKALEVPELDAESVLALRYDLGVALEAAGDSNSALDCFRQVYAQNIDYRDVADRIAALPKH
ncbi:MAG TPA: tetratricopeptide repeat protein [Candidatus Acidoferrum sp.]|nr:tetratricopeptide repeat protein [Candidatus Acidoferrum sp.]